VVWYDVSIDCSKKDCGCDIEYYWVEHTRKATSTACVLLTMPTVTEPCFTASAAYSTWKIRPWGELEAVSYISTRSGRVKNLQCDGVIVVVISEHLDNSAAPAAQTSRFQNWWNWLLWSDFVRFA
jgi:hypothetical protein